MPGSPIDTFWILFKTDAEDAEKGADKAKKSFDDLEKGIGGADDTSIQMGKQLNTLAAQAVAAFASIFAVNQMISGAQGIVTSSNELTVLGNILGESQTDITNWGRAVQSVGGDSSALEGSLRSLGGSLNDALITGANGATIALSQMGISVLDSEKNMRTVLDILPEIAQEFQGLKREAALARGAELGLDEGTILLLMRGRAAVEALVGRQKELNFVTDQQRETLAAMRLRWLETSNLMSDIGTVILAELKPAFDIFEGAMVSVFKFMSENKEFTLFFFGSIAAAIGVAASGAIVFATQIAAVFAVFVGVGVAIQAVVDDLRAFGAGQDSVIGDAAKRWQFVSDAIEGVGKVIDLVKEKLGNFWENFKPSAPDWLKAITSLTEGAGSLLDEFDEAYKNRFGPGDVEGAGNVIPFGPADIEAAQNVISMASRRPIPTAAQVQAPGVAAAGGGVSRSASVSIGELTIVTQAESAEAIAGSVTREMETQLQSALNEFDDGIAS